MFTALGTWFSLTDEKPVSMGLRAIKHVSGKLFNCTETFSTVRENSNLTAPQEAALKAHWEAALIHLVNTPRTHAGI